MEQIPVYVFTGFLDSGKTKFIQETLEDPRFNSGERTLLLVCEEGEEEYDFSSYPYKNVYLEVVDQDSVTSGELRELSRKHKAERVVAELNGMKLVGDLYARFPEEWAVAQEVMFADATTFQAYNANMRNLMMDKLTGAQMVIFNRVKPGEDTMPLHKVARAANRQVDILYEYTDGTVTTTLEYHTCETLGLVKMDFLGLSNLTVIRDTLNNIEANGKERIDHTKIPLDDRPTYDLLSRGDTLGVFQLDSDGMRSLLKTLKPNNFNDISALIALYRPGPMDMDSHTNYAKRKNGLQKITPIHPEVAEPLKEVLDETYGLIVYQEQVQSAARILAGYSLGKADVLRRAMGKKKPEVLAKEKIPFFAGMKEHGYSEEAAQAVWDILVPFSGYAFNKAHSAAYGLISYWTAYLKTHYPVEFMAALLQGASTNKDKTALYLGEARRMGIQVLSPDVNESVYEYSAVGDVVRFGLGAIRNVGKNAVDAIIAERENGHGKYVNFTDFIKRVPLEALNRRLVESLIKAGAFDSIDPNRRALFTIHETAINSVVGLKRKQAEGQFDLFADLDDSKENDSAMGDAMVQVPDVEEWDKKTKLNFEREMLGLYVSDHPLSGMQSILVSLREMSIAHLIDRAGSMPDGQQVTIAGLITNVDRRVSKKGNPWAIVTVEDLESSIQCMFFGKVYEAAAPELAVDTVVQIRGQVEKRDETVSMRATEFTVPTLEAQDERPLTIVLPPIALDQSHVRRLGQILTSHPGPCEVKLALMDDKGNAKVLTFGDRFRVKRDTSLFAEIKILFGPSSLPLA